VYESKKTAAGSFAVSIAIALAVGVFAALLTRDSMDIYSQLNTPPLAPPSWLFPVVWTVLYILMGISAALVWQRRKEDLAAASAGLSAYVVSLAVNFVWSILFFRCRWLLVSFFWLLALLALILRTIAAYRKVSPLAARLQIPYALWVTFAGYLNFAIWYLNRSL